MWKHDEIEHVEMMCEVADYIGIGDHVYAEVVDVFTMTLMFGDIMLERSEAKICRAFTVGHVA